MQPSLVNPPIQVGQEELPVWQALLDSTGDRAGAARAFLSFHNVTFSDLARRLDVSVSAVSAVVDGRLAPAARVDQLEAVGIPRFLLPRPGGRKSGLAA